MKQWCCKRQHGPYVVHTVSFCHYFLSWILCTSTVTVHASSHFLFKPVGFWNGNCQKYRVLCQMLSVGRQEETRGQWYLYSSLEGCMHPAPTLSLLHVCLPCHFATASNRLSFPGGIALFHIQFTRNGSWMMMMMMMYFGQCVQCYSLIMMDRWELKNLRHVFFFYCNFPCFFLAYSMVKRDVQIFTKQWETDLNLKVEPQRLAD